MFLAFLDFLRLWIQKDIAYLLPAFDKFDSNGNSGDVHIFVGNTHCVHCVLIIWKHNLFLVFFLRQFLGILNSEGYVHVYTV